MGAKKRIQTLEEKSAEGGKHEARMERMRVDADKQKMELESLSGIEKKVPPTYCRQPIC